HGSTVLGGPRLKRTDGADAGSVREEVGGQRADGAGGVARALHRYLSDVGSADAERGRCDRRVLRLREGGGEDWRWRWVRRRLEAWLLRVGVQGQAQGSGGRLPAAVAVPRGAREPAAAGGV